MDLDSHDLKDKETNQIVSRLIDHVAKSDEEIKREQEQEKPQTTELKVFVAENGGFELGTLSDNIESLSESKQATKHVQRFIDEHHFSEERLNDEVSFVEITTPDYERTDQFIFVDGGQYLKAVTAERRDWTKKTVEKLIQYLPSLDRLFLSSEDLQDIVETLPGTTISGFTAKYHSYHSDKSVTIQFHGGSKAELEKIKEEFGAKPTRLEFTQANSPEAVLRSSVDREGYFKYNSVLKGYEEQGRETLEEIFEQYEEHDRRHFEVEFTPEKIPTKSGFTIDGFTTLQLLEDEGDDHRELVERLEEDILSRKRRYEYSEWDTGNYLVFDKENNEPFEIGVEGRDLVLHAKEATTARTFRDFCHLILEEFNSTYQVEKKSGKLRV